MAIRARKIALALVLAASAFLFAAGCCTSPATQWEYRKVYGLNQVNQAAADGWTVVGFSVFIDTESGSAPHGQTEVYLLKRPKQSGLTKVPAR